MGPCFTKRFKKTIPFRRQPGYANSNPSKIHSKTAFSHVRFSVLPLLEPVLFTFAYSGWSAQRYVFPAFLVRDFFYLGGNKTEFWQAQKSATKAMRRKGSNISSPFPTYFVQKVRAHSRRRSFCEKATISHKICWRFPATTLLWSTIIFVP